MPKLKKLIRRGASVLLHYLYWTCHLLLEHFTVINWVAINWLNHWTECLERSLCTARSTCKYSTYHCVLHSGMSSVQQGVQKFFKIVNNGSILIIKYAIERLDKNKIFKRKRKNLKNCSKNLGWAVKKWHKRYSLPFFWQVLDKITWVKAVTIERD